MDELPDWQQREVEKALTYEAPTGNLKHIDRYLLRVANRTVVCGITLTHLRSKDIVNVWTFTMMFKEGREDLCKNCMSLQRKAWAGLNRPAFCTERGFTQDQPATIAA